MLSSSMTIWIDRFVPRDPWRRHHLPFNGPFPLLCLTSGSRGKGVVLPTMYRASCAL